MAEPAYNIVERLLPKKLHFLIDRYTTQASVESENTSLWSSLLRRYLWRVLLYSIVLIAIEVVSAQFLLPWLQNVIPSWYKLAGCVITLVVMSPFLLALSVPVSKKVERQRLKEANARFDVPLIVMSLFRFALAAAFVVYTLSSIFNIAIGLCFGLAIFIMLVVLFSKRIGNRLNNLESKFLDNLNERELRRSGKNNNLVSDLHMAFMTVGTGCEFVGERLADSNIRKRYGVNLVSIQRGAISIPIPGGNNRVFPGDVLGVIGNDEQIQALLPVVEAEREPINLTVSAADFKLTNVLLSESSPLLGHTSASANIRGKYTSLVVAIQRGEEFLKPNGEVVFQPQDIVWLVGDPKVIAQLK